jgi:F-type H+-transporting ATPase subunit b
MALLLAAAVPASEGQTHSKSEDHAVLWKLVNFVLLAGAFGYLMRTKGRVFFAARSKQIFHDLEESARLSREAEARYAEIGFRLASLSTHVEALREQAREESAAEAQRARQEIERDLKRIRMQAEQEIGAAAKAARQQLRAYTAELAVGLAEKKIRERLTPDSEALLLEGTLQDLEQRATAREARA